MFASADFEPRRGLAKPRALWRYRGVWGFYGHFLFFMGSNNMPIKKEQVNGYFGKNQKNLSTGQVFDFTGFRGRAGAQLEKLSYFSIIGHEQRRPCPKAEHEKQLRKERSHAESQKN